MKNKMLSEEKENLIKAWQEEEKTAFSGWDFLYLDKRWESEPTPWDYREVVLDYLKPDTKLLDMGTADGEFLLSLGHSPSLCSVTEAYPPNAELCRKKLEPLGITVKQIYSDNSIPYDENSFDLIISRHESFDLSEVYRMLKPGGVFITQQVGGKNCNSLSERLIENFKPAFPDHNLINNLYLLLCEEFEVLYYDEFIGTLKFFDTGAVVFYAKIIEWEFPGFSVGSCADKLLLLDNNLKRDGFIETKEERFIFAAKKPEKLNK